VFLAPTTTITAVLYYFGWVRASATYGYFGVDVQRTLGFSAAEYVRRSSTVVFTPLAILLLTAVLFLFLAGMLNGYLLAPGHHRMLVDVTAGVQCAAALTLICAAILLERPEVVAHTPLVKPALLAGGTLLALYAGHLRGLVSARPQHRTWNPMLIGALYRGLLGGVLVLAAFWATAILALQQGLEAAHALERGLVGAPGVVVYAHTNQYITGPGVKVAVLSPTDAGFRFRYTGLRLLARTADGGYVLLPRGWTHAYGSPTYVLPPSAGIRVDLQALPAD
jgi:hypothetical protein